VCTSEFSDVHTCQWDRLTHSLTHTWRCRGDDVECRGVAVGVHNTPRPTVSGRPVSSWVFLAHHKPVPTHCNQPLQCCHHCCSCNHCNHCQHRGVNCLATQKPETSLKQKFQVSAQPEKKVLLVDEQFQLSPSTFTPPPCQALMETSAGRPLRTTSL
jgi:hypothetical protein